MEHKPDDIVPTLRDLYPHLTEQELAQAEDGLERYLALVLQILERMEMEGYPQVPRLTPDAGTLSCGTPKKTGPTA